MFTLVCLLFFVRFVYFLFFLLGAQLSPVKIVREPDGSLVRAANQAGINAKERKEAKEIMQETMLAAIPKVI